MQPYSADAYATQLAQLLPPGAAWTHEDGTVLAALLAALAQEPARVDAMAHELLAELDPHQTLQLLPQWEAMCGLPDQCSQVGETIAERRAAVLAKLSAQGGQTPEHFAELATLLAGAVCTVREYRPFRAGMSCAGDPLSNGPWAHTFAVEAPATSVRPFLAGQGCAGEPLRRWGNERLECTIRRLAPAHTIVSFHYGV